MELSDEHKRRILEEEQQRLAENQYRAQVRQELRTQTVAPSTTSPVAEPPPKNSKRSGGPNYVKFYLIIVPAIVAGLWIVVTVGRSLKNNASEPYAPSVIESKHVVKIGTSQFVVNAGKVLYYRIPVKDMRDIHSTGHFLALGGQGNDIDVVLADETEFGKWMDKQSAKVYYQSGKTTSGDIDVKLSPFADTYYLCFDNRFSVLSAKTSNADISLFYSTVTLK